MCRKSFTNYTNCAEFYGEEKNAYSKPIPYGIRDNGQWVLIHSRFILRSYHCYVIHILSSVQHSVMFISYIRIAYWLNNKPALYSIPLFYMFFLAYCFNFNLTPFALALFHAIHYLNHHRYLKQTNTHKSFTYIRPIMLALSYPPIIFKLIHSLNTFMYYVFAFYMHKNTNVE